MHDETLTHFMAVCPRLVTPQQDILLNQVPTADMTWSVRTLLDFSYHLRINETFEGTWADRDPLPDGSHSLDISLGLDWLEDDPGDENNKHLVTTSGM